MKKLVKIGGRFAIGLKSSFVSPHLFKLFVNWSLYFFKKYISVLNFIFLFFNYLLVEEREGVAGFRLIERKLELGKIQATKIIDFCVKWFHMTRGL
jgi:hypothetical protein